MTEREQFEAWAKVRYAKNPHFWLRQIDDGGYSCGMADSAWNAWQVARAQPAQAVPVLAESELRSILQGTNHMIKNAMHGAFWPELEEACRAVEQAVRAKLGVAVPMTDGQALDSISRAKGIGGVIRTDGQLFALVREVERHHGIVGKEGE